MDTFVDSAWYFLRYCDPHNEHEPFSRRLADFWAPVDQYIGGIDHATGHLLYSRFFVKVLNELGMVGFREPFQRLFHQGWVRQGGTKMSKSRGNVTAPDQLAEMYGADAIRLYILFVGPADQDMDWTEEGIEGIGRFLRRLWRIVHEAAEAPGGLGRRRRAAGAKGARDDREGERRHRAPVRLQHADRRGDGAGERARARPVGARRALRGRDRGLADPAVRAAHRRGAVGDARARAAVGAAVAGRRRVAAGARDLRAGAAGERPRARPGGGVGGRERGASWSSGRRPRRGCRRTWTARRSGRRSSSRGSSSTWSSSGRERSRATVFLFTRAPGWEGVRDGTRRGRAEVCRDRAECAPISAHFRHEGDTHP